MLGLGWLFIPRDQPTVVLPGGASVADRNDLSAAASELEKPIPQRVLWELELRFEEIRPTMGEKEVLKTLRLDNYPKYLSEHHKFIYGGGGTNRKIYILSDSGHELEFRDFMGARAECILHLPEKGKAMETKIGQPVSLMDGWHEFMNRRP
jgi:hypothetical protein